MKILDLYTPLVTQFEKQGRRDLKQALRVDSRLAFLGEMAEEWGQPTSNVERWMASAEYAAQKKTALAFIKLAPERVKNLEKHFKAELTGELRLSPSMMRFDGFARFDLGHHNVWFGVDHPDADDNYLKVLLAHELSHVFRDHQPAVWAHLKKPINKVTRQEYLDAGSAKEHLVSEGLATLNSQIVHPEVPLHVHHYYTPEEMKWCLERETEIEKAIQECLKGDENVWKFYEDDIIAPGSPSRTQYFWAARRLSDYVVKKFKRSLGESVLLAHARPAEEFECF